MLVAKIPSHTCDIYTDRYREIWIKRDIEKDREIDR